MSERWDTRIVPRSEHARLVAAETLMAMERWRDVNSDRLRADLDPFFDAGWCIDALVRALHVRPDGSAQSQVSTGRRIDLVRYCLNQWRDGGEVPLAPPVAAGEGTGAVVSTSAEEERQKARARVHREWPRSVMPETTDQVAAAVRAFRAAMRWRGDQIGDSELRELVSPFFGAGWSVECLTFALQMSGVTKQPSPFSHDPARPLGEAIRRRLETWADKRGFPKRPPKEVLSYDEWDAKKAALGAYEVRERRRSASQVQLEALRQTREADARRRQRRAQERLAEARGSAKWERSLEALYEIGPAAQRAPVPDGPVEVAGGHGQHERLIKGVSYLAATDPGLIRWLRSLVAMEPEEIGHEAAQVTRARLRDSRMVASLASLEQYGEGGQELSGVTRVLVEYVAGAPDLEAGQEVRELWQVLRTSIRAHDRRSRGRD